MATRPPAPSLHTSMFATTFAVALLLRRALPAPRCCKKIHINIHFAALICAHGAHSAALFRKIMRFYLIGKIGGVKVTPETKKKFKEFEDTLRAQDIVTEVINPTSDTVQSAIANITRDCKNEREAYRLILAHDLTLLARCDAAALLPDWLSSNGAHVECGFCRRTRIPQFILVGDTLRRLMFE